MEQYIDKAVAVTNILRVFLNPAWKCTYQSKDQSSSGIFLLMLSLVVATVRRFQEKGLLWSRP